MVWKCFPLNLHNWSNAWKWKEEMNNKPVAWMDSVGNITKQNLGDFIPLYTHPTKEYFEDEPQAEELHEILQSNAELTDEEIQEVYSKQHEIPCNILGFARAILRKARD